MKLYGIPYGMAVVQPFSVVDVYPLFPVLALYQVTEGISVFLISAFVEISRKPETFLKQNNPRET